MLKRSKSSPTCCPKMDPSLGPRDLVARLSAAQLLITYLQTQRFSDEQGVRGSPYMTPY